jgi:hypothetical protein
MRRSQTHYDNLQVSRSASEEVIRAAYRSLSQKHHPDRNPDDRESAERIMKILNAAYAVLSDAGKRLEYDLMLQKREASDTASSERTRQQDSSQSEAPSQSQSRTQASYRKTPSPNQRPTAPLGSWFVIGLCIVMAIMWRSNSSTNATSVHASPNDNNANGVVNQVNANTFTPSSPHSAVNSFNPVGQNYDPSDLDFAKQTSANPIGQGFVSDAYSLSAGLKGVAGSVADGLGAHQTAQNIYDSARADQQTAAQEAPR